MAKLGPLTCQLTGAPLSALPLLSGGLGDITDSPSSLGGWPAWTPSGDHFASSLCAPAKQRCSHAVAFRNRVVDREQSSPSIRCKHDS